jgi:HK97 family phage prohead protease
MANERLEQKDFKFTIQDEPNEKGIFRGNASVFGAIDSYGETVDAGAFKKTLKENKHFPMLDTHDVMRRLGIIFGLEDETGLQSEGHFNLDTQAGREARSLAMQGAFTGLSIGFQTLKEKMVDGVRHLKEIKLWEISLCVFQACPGALITDVKSNMPLTIEALSHALIGWTTDKEFKVNALEIPLLKSAGESINALLKIAEPVTPLAAKEKPQEDADILSKIISMTESFKQTNQILRRINGSN